MPVPLPDPATPDDECFVDLSARTWSDLRLALARATGGAPDDALLPLPEDIDPPRRNLRLLDAARHLRRSG